MASRRRGQAAAEQRYRFFGGKGGVGKTTCAAAAAVALAETGRSVLLVSLDPAHSLGDALDRALSAHSRRLRTSRGRLDAVELDADAALHEWIGARRPALKRLLSRGTYLDDDDVEELLRLSLPGVDELIGLLELTRLAGRRPYDEIVVDAAPTGHLLRLLAMPESLKRLAGVLDALHAKHRFLAAALGGQYRSDSSDDVIAEIESQSERLAGLLRDRQRCQVWWVLLPELMAVEETKDAVAALRVDGIGVSDLVVNRVTTGRPENCPACAGRAQYERAVLADVQDAFRGMPVRTVPALAREPRGIAKLRSLGRRARFASAGAPPLPSAPAWPAPARLSRRLGEGGSLPRRVSPSRADDRGWLDELAPPGMRLLLFAGKGGVGKTSCAAAVALALSARAPRRRVLLLSIDPAHSLGDVMAAPVGDTPRPIGDGRLHLRELDTGSLLDRRRRRYVEAVDEAFATLRDVARFDPSFDRVVLEHLVDLAPPGLDELLGLLEVLAALRAGAASQPRYDMIVLDTAPTGHTLRLLAMPRAGLEWVHAFMALWLKYRKVIGLGDLAWDLVSLSRDLREVATLLADPQRSRAVVVTRPAELPARETRRLIAGVRGLGITLGAVIMNTVTANGCRRCREAKRRDRDAVDALGAELGAIGRPPIIEAPIRMPPPRGARSLAGWGRSWTRTA